MLDHLGDGEAPPPSLRHLKRPSASRACGRVTAAGQPVDLPDDSVQALELHEGATNTIDAVPSPGRRAGFA